MFNFKRFLETKQPHLVIRYQPSEGKSPFSWGVSGSIPIVNLIGAIIEIQGDLLAHRIDPNDLCDEPVLVVTYNAEENNIYWFVNEHIPISPLVGTIEIVKQVFVSTELAQMVMSKPRILGPDGGLLRT